MTFLIIKTELINYVDPWGSKTKFTDGKRHLPGKKLVKSNEKQKATACNKWKKFANGTSK